MTYSLYDPTAETSAAEGDWDKLMMELGWDDFISVGAEDSSLWLVGRRRIKGTVTEYVVEIQNLGGWEAVRTDSFMEYMDLLARWAPAVQAAAIAGFIGELGDTDISDYNTVGRIAAKWQTGDDVLSYMRRNQMERIRAAQARRRAASNP